MLGQTLLHTTTIIFDTQRCAQQLLTCIDRIINYDLDYRALTTAFRLFLALDVLRSDTKPSPGSAVQRLAACCQAALGQSTAQATRAWLATQWPKGFSDDIKLVVHVSSSDQIRSDAVNASMTHWRWLGQMQKACRAASSIMVLATSDTIGNPATLEKPKIDKTTEWTGADMQTSKWKRPYGLIGMTDEMLSYLSCCLHQKACLLSWEQCVLQWWCILRVW